MDTKTTPRRMNIVETADYENVLQRVTFEKVAAYLKGNQGKTFDNILEDFEETDNRLCMEHLFNVWVNNWNTFFQSGGRIVQKSERFYCLSPRNPESRKRVPNIIVNM